MFEEIMAEIEKSEETLTVGELARRVGVEKSALKKMLEFLERKGKLTLFKPEESSRSNPRCETCVYRKGCLSSLQEED